MYIELYIFLELDILPYYSSVRLFKSDTLERNKLNFICKKTRKMINTIK